MEQGKIAFTAVYLKASNGYVGFIEELPGVIAHGNYHGIGPRALLQRIGKGLGVLANPLDVVHAGAF